MNTRQIDCFLEVCKEMNFTRAAEKLFIPQPAVSRYIAGLEQELGTKLFIRTSNRNISLSDDGKRFYNMFVRFSKELNDAIDDITTELHPLRLGYNSGWNLSGFLSDVIDGCRSANPDFNISIECLGFTEATDALISKQLDAIITIENNILNIGQIEFDRVADIDRYIIYSKKHFPDASSPKDFYNMEFLLADDPQIRQISAQIEHFCAPYHFTPMLRTVANMPTVIACVENGLGVAIIDEWAQGINDPNVGHFEIGSKHHICLAWRDGSYTREVRLFHEQLLNRLNRTSE